MGKSTCAAWFVDRGIAVVDTDTLAHQLTQPGSPALAEIASTFGSAIVDPNGRLDRRALAQMVFSDDVARERLEGILHPRIQELWLTEAEKWRAESRSTGVVVIPLLFETQAESMFDATLCVACSRSTQAARLVARGWTSEEAARRISSQMSIDQKMVRSDFVIWSEGRVEVLGEQLQRVLGA